MLWNTQSYLFLGRELISCKLSEWCVWLFHTCGTRKRVPLSSPGHPATKIWSFAYPLQLYLILYGPSSAELMKFRQLFAGSCQSCLATLSRHSRHQLRSCLCETANALEWVLLRTQKKDWFCLQMYLTLHALLSKATWRFSFSKLSKLPFS